MYPLQEDFSVAYTFQKPFDVGVDDLKTLGVFWELLFYFFRSNKQRLQIRPRPLNFLKDGKHVTGGKAGKVAF